MIITFPGLLFEVDEDFTDFRDHRFPDLFCEAKFLIVFSDHHFLWPVIGGNTALIDSAITAFHGL